MNCSEKEESRKISFLNEQITEFISCSAVQWSIKNFFAPSSPIFQIRLAEKREEGEERMQMQSILCFTQKKYIVMCYLTRQEI